MKPLTAALALPSLLATLLVGCVTDPAQPDDDQADLVPDNNPDPHGPPPSFRPQTCQEIVDHRPGSADGQVTLYIQGQAGLAWEAYCADMQGAPREYLTLGTGAGQNTSMFAAGATSAVVTEYQRVRINPTSLTIDISDQTFATSTGALSHNGITVTSMPFGVAMTCGGLATANVDLTGTPFRAEDAFPVKGANMIAKYELTPDRKALDMSIDGSTCGWIAPALAPSDPINAAGASVLRLSYVR